MRGAPRGAPFLFSLAVNIEHQAKWMVEDVLSGKLSDGRELSRLMRKLPRVFGERSPLALALHQASHFIADAGLRGKNPA